MDARTARAKTIDARLAKSQEYLKKVMPEIEKAVALGDMHVRVFKMDHPAKTSLEQMGYTVKPFVTVDLRGGRCTDGWIIEW